MEVHAHFTAIRQAGLHLLLFFKVNRASRFSPVRTGKNETEEYFASGSIR